MPLCWRFQHKESHTLHSSSLVRLISSFIIRIAYTVSILRSLRPDKGPVSWLPSLVLRVPLGCMEAAVHERERWKSSVKVLEVVMWDGQCLMNSCLWHKFAMLSSYNNPYVSLVWTSLLFLIQVWHSNPAIIWAIRHYTLLGPIFWPLDDSTQAITWGLLMCHHI